jgi:pimeloyl-ACP methyl ester carboxylesterase
MRTLVDAVPGTSAPLLLALLSGSFTEPEDFIREGFVSAVRSRGIGAQIAMAEIRMAYFADGSIVERIRESVVLPALERGASRIWFAGISLGALASLAFAARHENDLEGMVLISPYPGTRLVLREIDAEGGLASWHPRIGPEGDLEREAWRWLARRAHGGPAPRGAPWGPDVHFYFGAEDRFAEGQRKMAQALPAHAVHEMPGGHEWPDWRRMWNEFLEHKALQ